MLFRLRDYISNVPRPFSNEIYPQSYRKTPKEITYLFLPAIIIVIYLGSSEENNHALSNNNKICQKCFSPIKLAPVGPVRYCRKCARKQRYAAALIKVGLILATIILQFAVLLAAVFLGGAAIATNNLALGLLALPAIVALFCYPIGGNKVTYMFLKSILNYLRNKQKNSFWEPIRDAIKGDGFMVGVALFVVFTLIGSTVIIISQFGDLGDDSFHAVAKMIMIPVILILIMPLIGIGAKIVGNEKAAAECGYNSLRGIFLIGNHHDREENQQDSGSTGDGGDGGSGDGGFSF